MNEQQNAGLPRPRRQQPGAPRLDFAEREVVLRANFDEADGERCLWTSMRFIVEGPRHPRVGEQVFLIDAGGGSSLGVVEELNGWQARVRLVTPGDASAAAGAS